MPDTAPDLVSNAIGLLNDIGFDLTDWQRLLLAQQFDDFRFTHVIDYGQYNEPRADGHSTVTNRITLDITRPDTNGYRGRHRHPDIHPR